MRIRIISKLDVKLYFLDNKELNIEAKTTKSESE